MDDGNDIGQVRAEAVDGGQKFIVLTVKAGAFKREVKIKHAHWGAAPGFLQRGPLDDALQAVSDAGLDGVIATVC